MPWLRVMNHVLMIVPNTFKSGVVAGSLSHIREYAPRATQQHFQYEGHRAAAGGPSTTGNSYISQLLLLLFSYHRALTVNSFLIH